MGAAAGRVFGGLPSGGVEPGMSGEETAAAAEDMASFAVLAGPPPIAGRGLPVLSVIACDSSVGITGGMTMGTSGGSSGARMVSTGCLSGEGMGIGIVNDPATPGVGG